MTPEQKEIFTSVFESGELTKRAYKQIEKIRWAENYGHKKEILDGVVGYLYILLDKIECTHKDYANHIWKVLKMMFNTKHDFYYNERNPIQTLRRRLGLVVPKHRRRTPSTIWQGEKYKPTDWKRRIKIRASDFLLSIAVKIFGGATVVFPEDAEIPVTFNEDDARKLARLWAIKVVPDPVGFGLFKKTATELVPIWAGAYTAKQLEAAEILYKAQIEKAEHDFMKRWAADIKMRKQKFEFDKPAEYVFQDQHNIVRTKQHLDYGTKDN